MDPSNGFTSKVPSGTVTSTISPRILKSAGIPLTSILFSESLFVNPRPFKVIVPPSAIYRGETSSITTSQSKDLAASFSHCTNKIDERTSNDKMDIFIELRLELKDVKN